VGLACPTSIARRLPRLTVHSAAHADTAEALRQLSISLDRQPGRARLAFVFYGCAHDDHLLHNFLSQRLPGAGLIGGTSAGGYMTHRGPVGETGIGLMLLEDDSGDYGLAAGSLGDDPSQAARQLLWQALANAGCPGELPELIWVFQAPGHEEAVVDGLRQVVGDRCPIVGGSSADNDVSGRWRQLGPQGLLHDGLVVAALFPSSPVGSAFQGGYEPAGPSGIVTAIGDAVRQGDTESAAPLQSREISQIDGMPAAEVYDRWLGGRLASMRRHGGSILAQTTLHPLAREAGNLDGLHTYHLIHPESITADGRLRSFCNVAVGDRLHAMKGDRQRLVERASTVAQRARQALPVRHPLAGALIVYCGGCKMAVDDDIAHVSAALSRTLGEAPFIGCFTFGEQGHLVDRNVHGNLMISAVAFGA
jgi:hypothetical protein